MQARRVLLTEGEKTIADKLSIALAGARYSVDLAVSGGMGRRFFERNAYDMVLIDSRLPDINGCDLCQYIRNRDNRIPLVMLSSGYGDYKFEGFQAGADDYVVLTDDYRELLLRMRALARRYHRYADRQKWISAGDIMIDVNTKLVRRGDRLILLSAKEFLLLQFLVRNKNRVVTRAEIVKALWGRTLYTKEGRVAAFVNTLRSKIGDDSPPRCIYTVTGKGYLLAEKSR